MPLVVAPLQSELLTLFGASKPQSPAEASLRMASAYYKYGLQASAGGIAQAWPTPASQSALQGLLFAAMSSPDAGAPAKMAQAWADGLLAFWSIVPFSSGPTVGVFSAFAGQAAVAAALTGVLSNTQNTAESSAQLQAAALHVGTMTVLVTVTVPPGVGSVLSLV